MELEGVDHLAIPVAGLERSERFYTEVLGGRVVHRHGDRPFEKAAREVVRKPLGVGLRPEGLSCPGGGRLRRKKR